VSARQQEVLERFLGLAERAGAWQGVNLLSKAVILRYARSDSETIYQRIEQLVGLWLTARGQLEEDDDAGRADHTGAGGGAGRLGGDEGTALGSLGRTPDGAPRADALAAGAAAAGAGLRTRTRPGGAGQ